MEARNVLPAHDDWFDIWVLGKEDERDQVHESMYQVMNLENKLLEEDNTPLTQMLH